MPVEPFTASSLLYDVAQSLDEFAKRYGVALQLDLMHSHPIIGNRELLTAAMISLGQVFVVAESQRDEPSFYASRRISLATVSWQVSMENRVN